MKIYAKSINLRDSEDLIAAYKKYHARPWPEVVASFREVGVEDIKIFLLGRRLFMLMTTHDDFDPEKDMERYLTLHPKNAEWEALMKSFQEKLPEAKPEEHWAEMEMIFDLTHH